MPTLSQRSQSKLSTCEEEIQQIVTVLIEEYDVTVVTGHRTKEEQDRLYPKYSKLKWPDGKHNKLPSMAIDLAPYHSKYGALFGSEEQVQKIADSSGKSKERVRAFIRENYYILAGRFLSIAYSLCIPIRWGGDWNSDGDILDNSFDDLGHFELRNT